MCDRIKNVIVYFIIIGMAFVFLTGCDSGEKVDKVIDKATGNQALKQYEVAKSQLKAIEEQQKERYKNGPGDESQENK